VIDSGRALGSGKRLLARRYEIVQVDAQVGEDDPADSFIRSRQALEDVGGVCLRRFALFRMEDSGVKHPLGAPCRRRRLGGKQKPTKPRA
jgi:hypothetical protein